MTLAKERPKGRKPIRAGRVLLYFILVTGSCMMAYPMIFGVAASFASAQDYYSKPYWFPVPRHFTLENYEAIVRPAAVFEPPAGRLVLNTLFRIAWYTIVPGAIAVWAGYAFARLRFRGREQVFLFLLSSMMIPGIVCLIPTYVLLARFPFVGGNNWLGQGGTGFINRWGSLLITGLVNVYYIFLMRQTFVAIPRDFEDAAQIDGASLPQVMRHIYLPMVKPALMVMVLFQAVGVWNDYQWPLIVSTGNRKLWTVALGTAEMMFAGQAAKGTSYSGSVDYRFAFAMATVMSLPAILLFIFLQRYFVEGMRGFAIKG